MKRIFLLLPLALVPAGAAAVSAPSAPPVAAGAPAHAIYRCPMHPWIHSETPGKCTICGMNLVAVGAGASTTNVVSLGAGQVTAIGVATAPVRREPLVRTLRVSGRIDDDDTRHRILAARVPGRVEQLQVNTIGAEVVAGAPLATIYSPDMLTAQRIFVERLRAGETAFTAAERSAARERLFELGLTEPEIQELEKSLQPSATVALRAPMTGTVVAKSVYEGQYVAASDRLFEIADFSSMWFLFDAYEQDIPWLAVGQPVEITTAAVPGESIRAPIAFIDPNFDEDTRTTKVRVVIPNPHFGAQGEHHRLPHRVPAEGRVRIETPAVLTAPRSAVLDAGDGPVAYVDRGEGAYEQRRLRLGRRGDDRVEVLAGLKEGDAVVTHGALLIDAQARLSPPPDATPAAAASSPGVTTP
jgi:Cu(I)/Ag(I) efflux system membrane fusion protein